MAILPLECTLILPISPGISSLVPLKYAWDLARISALQFVILTDSHQAANGDRSRPFSMTRLYFSKVTVTVNVLLECMMSLERLLLLLIFMVNKPLSFWLVTQPALFVLQRSVMPQIMWFAEESGAISFLSNQTCPSNFIATPWQPSLKTEHLSTQNILTVT